ncbi:MAG: protein kinase [Planctomycetes bacterium]|nr:protein kinase [Planctomycetota bacterium]
MHSSERDQQARLLSDALRQHEQERQTENKLQELATDPACKGLTALLRFEIESMLGEGSSAVVYRAWDRQLKRPVALKMLRSGYAGDPRARARFIREARTVAQIAHPNVTAVYDVGEEDGRFYFVMELIEGNPFNLLVDGRADLSYMLGLLAKASRGLAAAHDRGIVHRDMKPSNILVTTSGEPKVTDFGLAKVAEATVELTRYGEVMGTPAYMAPEQVAGRTKDISPATDVYALGVILYEILTGQRPHNGNTPSELYASIMHQSPVPPRKINPALDASLEEICLKALQRDPRLRYATAGHFAAAVERYLMGDRRTAPSTPILNPLWQRLHFIGPAVLAVLLIAALASRGVFAGAPRAEQRQPEASPPPRGTSNTDVGQAVTGPREATALQIDADRERVEGSLETLLAVAEEMEHEGKPEQARRYYQRALDKDPANAAAQEGMRRTSNAFQSHLASASTKDAAVSPEAQAQAFDLLQQARTAIEAALGALHNKTITYDEFTGRVAEGQHLIEEALSKAGDLALAHYLMGRSWEIRGQWDLAEASLRKAIGADENFGLAHYRLGRLMFAKAGMAAAGAGPPGLQGNEHAKSWLAQAVMELSTALRSESALDPLERQAASSMIALAHGDTKSGKRLAQEGLGQAGPGGRRESVADLYWLEGLSEEGRDAVGAFSQALEIASYHIPSLVARGNTLTKERQALETAQADVERAAQLGEDLPPVYLYSGALHQARGNPQRAIEDYEKAMRLAPDYALAYVYRGIARAEMGQLDAAIADYTQALTLDATLVTARAHRGFTLYRKGDNATALVDLNEAVRTAPDQPEPYVLRGLVLAGTGDVTRGLGDLNDALRVSPTHVEAYYYRGVLRASQGDVPAAMQDLDSAIALAPKHADALFERGSLYLQGNDYPKAVSDLAAALKAAPKNWPKRTQAQTYLAQARGQTTDDGEEEEEDD